MRVLALVTDGFGGFGGIARYNQTLFEGLLASGDVDMVVLPDLVPPPACLWGRSSCAPAAVGQAS